MAIQAYELYAERARQTTSLEAVATLSKSQFDAARNDDSAIQVAVDGEVLPFAMPDTTTVADFSWVNRTYFSRAHGLPEDQPLHVAVMRPGDDYRLTNEGGRQLHKIAKEDGMLLVEYPSKFGPYSEEMDHGTTILNRMLGQVGLQASNETHDHKHMHYLNRTTPIATPPVGETREPALEALYRAHVETPVHVDDSDISVERVMHPDDIDKIWEFYEPGHQWIGKYDPLAAGFTQGELRDVLSDQRILKFVSRFGSDILNVAVLTDITEGVAATLTNRAYLEANYPDDLANRQIMFSPGLFRNPNVRHPQKLSSEATMGYVGRLIVRAGLSPIISYICNSTSDRVVPRLMQTIFPKQGLRVDNPQPSAAQAFGVYRFSSL